MSKRRNKKKGQPSCPFRDEIQSSVCLLVLTCTVKRYIVCWGAWQDTPLPSVVVRQSGKSLNDWPGVGPNRNR